MSAARTEEGELAALDFKPVGEEDPFDYDIVVEIDHTESGDFVAKLTSWTHVVPEADVIKLAEEYADSVAAVVGELVNTGDR
ncbi:hypothetical protein ACN38_g3165 [Penicillium nordicum]|uniref:Uncharacterized protein n=1 Tax=Penicillium nordicum TaxID=229535 RepID=A0A0M8PCM0_9EURO|nr:hypothetical protein ACN38_g3165 [Penicillium nordicum]